MTLQDLMAKYPVQAPAPAPEEAEGGEALTLPVILGARDVRMVWWPRHNGFTLVEDAAPGQWTDVPQMPSPRNAAEWSAQALAEVLRLFGVRMFVSDAMSFQKFEVGDLRYDIPYGIGYLVRDDWPGNEFDYLRALWAEGGATLERHANHQDWQEFKGVAGC